MTNRAERRRQIRVSVLEGGPVVEAVSKFSAPMPEQRPGEHLWLYASMFRVADPKADRFIADMENLVTIEGPFCWWCEEHYTADIGDCRGDPWDPA